MYRYKSIYKSISAILVLPLLLGMCTKSDKVFTFTSKVITEGSTSAADQAATSLWFSTDNGATYSLTPFLSVGKKFKVKVMDDNTGVFFIDKNCFAVDWSLSNPPADNPTSENPEFTMADNTAIVAKVTSIPYTATDTSGWSGDYSGAEKNLIVDGVAQGNGSTDAITIKADLTTPNGLIMNNFFGDGAGITVHFVLNPSTNLNDQLVTVPVQQTDDPGTASGSGTYNQCTKALNISVTYVAFGSTFQWTYVITKL
jgi:hypothetical protein